MQVAAHVASDFGRVHLGGGCALVMLAVGAVSCCWTRLAHCQSTQAVVSRSIASEMDGHHQLHADPRLQPGLGMTMPFSSTLVTLTVMMNVLMPYVDLAIGIGRSHLDVEDVGIGCATLSPWVISKSGGILKVSTPPCPRWSNSVRSVICFTVRGH